MTVHHVARGFETVADAYDRSRPEYPDEAVDLVARVLDLRPGRRLLEEELPMAYFTDVFLWERV